MKILTDKKPYVLYGDKGIVVNGTGYEAFMMAQACMMRLEGEGIDVQAAKNALRDSFLEAAVKEDMHE